MHHQPSQADVFFLQNGVQLPAHQTHDENYAMGLVRRELDAILEEEDIRLGGLVVHTTLDLDLQNATLDAINKHMDALEARKGIEERLASLQARREKRGVLKNKLTTKAEYEASLAAWKAPPAEQKEKTHPPMPNYIQSAAVVMDDATGSSGRCRRPGRGRIQAEPRHSVQAADRFPVQTFYLRHVFPAGQFCGYPHFG